MSKNHGARQQKKVAKQKAKRAERRNEQSRRTSNDPTVRLANAEHMPVVHALVAKDLWKNGIGYTVLTRRESGGQLIFGCYLVDVYCLGVKDAFWSVRTDHEFADVIKRMGQTQTLMPIDPAALVKIINGAVEYARSFGFHPHPDFRNAALLFKGIDPDACTTEFTFGKDGKPFYFRGPNESYVEANAIIHRVVQAGGHYMSDVRSDDDDEGFVYSVRDDDDRFDEFDDEDFEDEDDDMPSPPFFPLKG